MGTILKYLFYIILIIVLYLVGRGIYEGQITETTTVGEVMSEVGAGTKDIVKKGVDATVDAAGDALDTTEDKTEDVVDAAKDKTEEAVDAAKVKADEYKAAPKEHLVVD